VDTQQFCELEKQMNKILISTILMAAAGLTVVRAQYSQYGAVENFYQANPDLGTNQYAGRAVNPSYWLVDWNRWQEMEDRLISNGFARLGISNWESDNTYGGGVPQKELAIAYAQSIGADFVIYATHPATDKYNYSEHLTGFYARQGTRRAAPAMRPTSAEATAAINRAEDAWHEPRVKGGVWYDPQTDTYNWIGPSGQRRSKSASWFLDKFGPYLY
jgi:hypothetical protein